MTDFIRTPDANFEDLGDFSFAPITTLGKTSGCIMSMKAQKMHP